MLKIIVMVLSLVIALPVYALDGAALLKKIDRNLSPESFEMYRKLINVEPDGKKKEFTLFSVKKGTDRSRRSTSRTSRASAAGSRGRR